VVASIIPVTIRYVTVFVLVHIAVKLKFYTVADNTVFSCWFQKQ